MEVMIQGGVWDDSIARLGLQYCCVVPVVVPRVGFTSLVHTGRRLGSYPLVSIGRLVMIRINRKPVKTNLVSIVTLIRNNGG